MTDRCHGLIAPTVGTVAPAVQSRPRRTPRRPVRAGHPGRAREVPQATSRAQWGRGQRATREATAVAALRSSARVSNGVAVLTALPSPPK